MIRRTRSIIFLAIILGSTVILSMSTFYQVDTYRAFSFNWEITEIRVVKNETSGVYHRIEVQVQMDNPSLTTPLHFSWTDTRIWLNGETLRYGWGIKGAQFTLQPGESHEFGWHYATPEDDWEQLNESEATETWNWFLYQEPYVSAGFLESIEVIRMNEYVGVTIIRI
jgi:hypothetical protein